MRASLSGAGPASYQLGHIRQLGIPAASFQLPERRRQSAVLTPASLPTAHYEMSIATLAIDARHGITVPQLAAIITTAPLTPSLLPPHCLAMPEAAASKLGQLLLCIACCATRIREAYFVLFIEDDSNSAPKISRDDLRGRHSVSGHAERLCLGR